MSSEHWGHSVGEEARKNFQDWIDSGFYETFLAGEKVLDIGFAGYIDDVHPITPSAIGIGLDYPGYDGRTLPFEDGSQDAVFASHCLEHIEDYRASLADWFRVIRVGGYLIITVPHQYLYERNLRLPSRFNLDHRRLYTPASLLREVEESLDSLCYRVRILQDNDKDFDYSIPPKKHAVGCYEIILVLEKLPRPEWAGDMVDEPKIPDVRRGTFVPFPRPLENSPALAIASTESPTSILAFKMDHLGDFVLATPALFALRRAFPSARITMVCGEWNTERARELGIFDEIVGFSLFARNAALNSLVPLEVRLVELKQLLQGRHFDLAIDFRVDEDSRIVLKNVNAKMRAGVGYPRDFDYLDIALPMLSPTTSGRTGIFNYDASFFTASIGENRGYEIEIPAGDYETGDNLIYGPYRSLPPSRYLIKLLMKNDGDLNLPFVFDIVHDLGRRKITQGACEDIVTAGVWVDIREPVKDLEIRVFGQGSPSTKVIFRGCSIFKEGAMEQAHQSEIMAMLVALVEQRTRFLPVEEHLG